MRGERFQESSTIKLWECFLEGSLRAALGHRARRTPLLTSEFVTQLEVEVRQGHVLQGNDVACSERYSES